MSNSYGYHLLCRWLALNVVNCWPHLPYSSRERGNLSQFQCWFSCACGLDCTTRQAQTHLLSRRKSASAAWAGELQHCESDCGLGSETGVTPLGRHLLQRPVSLKEIADFAQTLKQPAYRNLKAKVNLKVTSFKGATSKTFISFTTPLVLGNGLLSFIIPTSSPACLLWVQHQNPSPSIKGCFLAI